MEEIKNTVRVVDIQFRPGQKVYYFDPAGLDLHTGDHVIIDTARGPEYGTCASGVHNISEKDVVAPLRQVLRIATAQDEKTVEDNRAKEKRAFEVCNQKIYDAVDVFLSERLVEHDLIETVEKFGTEAALEQLGNCLSCFLADLTVLCDTLQNGA